MCCWNTMKKAIPTASQNSNRSETQKLYRHVQQIAQRLDLQLQQANDWQEWFDLENLQLRQRVRDVCEHILMSGECELARKIEEYLWRKAFYDIIQKLKTDKKALFSNPTLYSVYSSHLQGALGFYHNLLVRLRNQYDIPLQGVIDWIGIPPEVDTNFKVTKEQMEWAFKACQRCLIYLGDIARYQLDISSEPNERHAERYYHLAILLNPEIGMPHNQIGTLKQNQSLLCESCYHYMRCIVAPHSFEGAEENVKRVLEKHNQNITELQEHCLKNKTLIDVKTQFTATFLSLQEVLFGIKSIPNEQLAEWCQSVITLFGLVLKGKVSINDGDSYQAKLLNGFDVDHLNTKDDSTEDTRLSSASLLKMFGMTILDVVQLKASGSEIVSAATAFTTSLLSQLLEFISQYLKQAFPSGDNDKNSKDQFLKMRKRIILSQRKRRRRRQFSSHSSEHSNSDDETYFLNERNEDELSDLSEGELDQELSDETSGDSDSLIEELSDDENDLEVARIIHEQNGSRSGMTGIANGVITKSARKNLSSLSKAGILLNKQLRKENHQKKFHLNSTTNGVIHDFALDNVDFINHAARLLDDFEKINEEAYLVVLKILFDWLRMNPDILKTSGKASPVLWNRIADVLNDLPSQKVVHTAVMYFSQRKRLPLWLRSDLEDGVDRPQKRALPEDITLFGAPGFEALHKTLDIKWFRGLSNSELYQFSLRITYLRNFGHYISKSKDVPCFTWNKEADRFVVAADLCPSESQPMEGLNGHPENQKSPNNKNKKIMEQRNEMMKALAKQKLKHDVNELEKKLKTSGASPSEQSTVYLVLDTPALCRHLSLLRTLVKSANFVVIIPTQVIAALDELKKFNPGARDAIKFLEDEIKHGNRWLKTQKEHETVTDSSLLHNNNKKKKNREVEEWRFIQVVKCCLYFVEKHPDGQSMVTLLTSDSSLQANSVKTANLGTRPSAYALDICKNKGIRVEPVVDFYKRWTTRNGPS